jgi:hypothetical protein
VEQEVKNGVHFVVVNLLFGDNMRYTNIRQKMKRTRSAVPQTHLSFVQLLERHTKQLNVQKEYGKRRLLDPPNTKDKPEYHAFLALENHYGPNYEIPPKGYMWTDDTHRKIKSSRPPKKNIHQSKSKKVHRAERKGRK